MKFLSLETIRKNFIPGFVSISQSAERVCPQRNKEDRSYKLAVGRRKKDEDLFVLRSDGAEEDGPAFSFETRRGQSFKADV